MKLRNKKTGEIREAIARDDGIYLKANWSDSEAWYLYTLDTLAHDWEYYIEPAEPLIKDEKIRKAVRAWAEANDYNIVKAGYDMVSEPDIGDYQIHFEDGDVVSEDNFGVHTIAELCGEEE